MTSIRNPGRFAGLLYMLMSIPGFFALLYVPSKDRARKGNGDGQNIAPSEAPKWMASSRR